MIEVKDIPIHFILGFIRSGSTVLMGFCREHPQIETDVVEPNHLFKLMQGVYFNWANYQRIMGLDVGTVQKFHYRAVRTFAKAFYEKICEKTGKNTVVIKHPYLTRYLEPLSHCFPQARFIILLRHPWDAIASTYHFTQTSEAAARIWGKEQLEKIIQGYERWMNEVVKETPRLVGEKRLMQMKFEAFLNNPSGYLKEIFKFLDVKYDDGIINTILNKAGRNELSLVGTALQSSVLNKPANKFKSILNEGQRAKVINRTKPYMASFKYTRRQ